jgi:hypothetical protein
MLKAVLVLLCVALLTSAAPTRVLFIGNSFTFVNDLPHQLINIAESLGKLLFSFHLFFEGKETGSCSCRGPRTLVGILQSQERHHRKPLKILWWYERTCYSRTRG